MDYTWEDQKNFLASIGFTPADLESARGRYLDYLHEDPMWYTVPDDQKLAYEQDYVGDEDWAAHHFNLLATDPNWFNYTPEQRNQLFSQIASQSRAFLNAPLQAKELLRSRLVDNPMPAPSLPPQPQGPQPVEDASGFGELGRGLGRGLIGLVQSIPELLGLAAEMPVKKTEDITTVTGVLKALAKPGFGVSQLPMEIGALVAEKTGANQKVEEFAKKLYDATDWLEGVGEGKIAPKAVGSLRDIDSLGDAFKWGMGSIGEGAPSIGASMIAYKLGGPAAAHAVATALQTASISKDIRDKTGETDPRKAALLGVATGYLEKIGVGKVMDNVVPKATMSFGQWLPRQIAKMSESALTEATTEGLQSIGERFAVEWAKEQGGNEVGNAVQAAIRNWNPETGWEALESAVAGGLLGFVAAGTAGGAEYAGNAPVRAQEEQTRILQGKEGETTSQPKKPVESPTELPPSKPVEQARAEYSPRFFGEMDEVPDLKPVLEQWINGDLTDEQAVTAAQEAGAMTPLEEMQKQFRRAAKQVKEVAGESQGEGRVQNPQPQNRETVPEGVQERGSGEQTNQEYEGAQQEEVAPTQRSDEEVAKDFASSFDTLADEMEKAGRVEEAEVLRKTKEAVTVSQPESREDKASDSLLKRAGRRTVWIEDLSPTAAAITEGKVMTHPIQGTHLSDGTIVMVKGQPIQNVYSALVHELFGHATEVANPEGYQEFMDKVREASPEIWDEAEQTAKDRNPGLEGPALLKETLGYIGTNHYGTIIDEVGRLEGTKKEKGALRRFADGVHDFLLRATKAAGLKLPSGVEYKQLDQVAKLFAGQLTGMKAGAETAKVTIPQEKIKTQKIQLPEAKTPTVKTERPQFQLAPRIVRKMGKKTWSSGIQFQNIDTPEKSEALAQYLEPSQIRQVLYHGSPVPEKVTTIKYKKLDKDALYGPGFYMTEDPEMAATYRKTKTADGEPVPAGKSGGVIPVYARIENPFYADKMVSGEDAKRLLNLVKETAPEAVYAMSRVKNGIRGSQLYNDIARYLKGKDKANAFLQEQGYDGITHLGGTQRGGKKHNVWISFVHPTEGRVKSAMGNIGDYSLHEKHTQYQLAPQQEQAGENPSRVISPEGRKDAINRVMFDHLNEIHRIQDEISEGRGGQYASIPEAVDLYLASSNYMSRAGAAFEQAQGNSNAFLDKLKKIHKLVEKKTGQKVDLNDWVFRMDDDTSVGKFLWALHAPERNKSVYTKAVINRVARLKKQLGKIPPIPEGIRVGERVQAQDINKETGERRGNIGKVTKIDLDKGTARVFFKNKEAGTEATRTIPLNQLERIDFTKQEKVRDEIDQLLNNPVLKRGSGMTDEQAQAHLDQLKEKGLLNWTEGKGGRKYTGIYGDIVKGAQGIAKKNLRLMSQSGRFADPELQDLAKYKYYVPLIGEFDPNYKKTGNIFKRAYEKSLENLDKALGMGELEGQPSPRAAKGFELGKGPARALGRETTTPPETIIPNLLAAYQANAIVAEKGRVNRVLLNMARQYSDIKIKDAKGKEKPLFEINKVVAGRAWDKRTGEIKSIEKILEGADTFTVTDKGNKYEIVINDPQFMSAMKNLGAAKAMVLAKTAGRVNRWLSKILTGYNPAFTLPNFTRDFAFAGIKLSQKETKAVQGKVLRRAFKKGHLIYKLQRGKTVDPATQKLWDRYKKSGGKINWHDFPSPEKIQLEMEKDMKLAESKPGNKAFHKMWSGTLKLVEDTNTAAENAVRFSLFVEATRPTSEGGLGLSDARAAQLSRDITVDFTKRGDIGPVINSLYLFSNASLQGTFNMFSTIGGRATNTRSRMLAGAIMSAGILEPLIASILMGEDDDGKPYWLGIPDFDKARNLIIPDLVSGNGKYFKIPLPYGFNVLHLAGVEIGNTFMGWGKPAAPFNIAAEAMDAVNPLGSATFSGAPVQGLMQQLSPSAIRPWMDIAVNRKFHGGPIRPEKGWAKKADSHNYFNSVSAPSRIATQALNEFAGGTPKVGGKILGVDVDINPEDIDHLVASYAGGVFDMLQNGASVAIKKWNGEDISTKEIPILSRFWGEQSEYYTPFTYYGHREHIQDEVDRQEYFRKEKPEYAKDHAEQYAAELKLAPVLKRYEKRIKAARSDAEKRRLQREFNKLAREVGL